MGWNFFASFLEKFSASLWRIFRRFQKSEKNFQQIDFRRALATCNEKWTTVWSGSACRSVWMLKKVRITSFLHYLSSPPRIGEKAGAEQPRNERNKRRRNFLRWTRRTTVWQLQLLRWTRRTSLLGFACLARFWWRIACGRWRTSDIRLWNRLWAPIKVNWSFYGIKLHSKAFLKHLQVSLWLQTGFEKKVVCNEREQNFKTRGILDMGAGSWSSTFLLPCFVELSKYSPRLSTEAMGYVIVTSSHTGNRHLLCWPPVMPFRPFTLISRPAFMK